MDELILGDNQFFGVSHMSEERGMERLRRFQDTAEIIRVLDEAYDMGLHAFTFSTHDRVAELCDHFRADPQRYADLRLYPVLPYAQKYAHLVNEKGVMGAVSDVLLGDGGLSGAVSMLFRGSMAAVTQDPIRVMKLLVDMELRMFRGLRLGAVFLQNNVADLVLGIGAGEVMAAFAEHVESKHDTRAGFMSLNMPRMVKFLRAAGIERPLVCAAVNKIGFQMNPDRASYEELLHCDTVDAMAMSVMAACCLTPREAIEYVAQFPAVRSIVFGASSKGHLEQTIALAKRIGWC